MFFIVRKSVPPDADIVQENIPVSHGVILVAFNDLDDRAEGPGHDAHMVSPGGAVAAAPLVPDIVDIISGPGQVALILPPAAQFLEQIDLLFAAALHGDDLRQSRFQSHGTSKSGAPVVIIGDFIGSGTGFIAVVKIDDRLMCTITFVEAQILLRGLQDMVPQDRFFFTDGPVDAPDKSCGDADSKNCRQNLVPPAAKPEEGFLQKKYEIGFLFCFHSKILPFR